MGPSTWAALARAPGLRASVGSRRAGALALLTLAEKPALFTAPFIGGKESLVRTTGMQTLPEGTLLPGLARRGAWRGLALWAHLGQWGLCCHVSWDFSGAHSLLHRAGT